LGLEYLDEWYLGERSVVGAGFGSSFPAVFFFPAGTVSIAALLASASGIGWCEFSTCSPAGLPSTGRICGREL
jgi:hypothetical protein